MSSDEKDSSMKNNPESKGGAGPATNTSFNPERGYGTTEQKEKIKQADKE
jgi:hypothetical protein